MKKFGKPQFLLHYRELLESPAWLGLSPRALKVLGRLELEHLRHGGQDNGKLPVIYDDFQALGISRKVVAPTLRKLVALGLLEITEKGRAGIAGYGKPNLFRLTYLPAYGKPATNEWRSLSAPTATDSVPQGVLNSVPPGVLQETSPPVPEGNYSLYAIHCYPAGVT